MRLLIMHLNAISILITSNRKAAVSRIFLAIGSIETQLSKGYNEYER